MPELLAKPIRRDLLATFLKTPRLISEFEDLVSDVSIGLPESISEVQTAAATAQATAVAAQSSATAAAASAAAAQATADQSQALADAAALGVFGNRPAQNQRPVNDYQAVIASRIFR